MQRLQSLCREVRAQARESFISLEVMAESQPLQAATVSHGLERLLHETD